MTEFPAGCQARLPSQLSHVLLLALALGLAAALPACEGAPPEAEETPDAPGPFEARVSGALRDSLRGEATARFDSTGRLAGLELDGTPDTAQTGLSFELAPRPSARRRTYTVAPRDRGGREDTSFTLMNAYLRLRGYEFAARAGSLQVERDSTGLSGAFVLRLRGMVEAASDEPATVTARGRFDGVSPSGAPSDASGSP